MKHKDDLLVETKIPIFQRSVPQRQWTHDPSIKRHHRQSLNQEWGMTSSRREAACWRELGRVESIQGVHEPVTSHSQLEKERLAGPVRKEDDATLIKVHSLSRGNGRNELWNINLLYSIQTNLTSKTKLFKDLSVSFPVVFKYLFWMLEKWISVGHFLCTILDLKCFWIAYLKLNIMWCWIVYAWNLVTPWNGTAYSYC